MKQRWTHNFCKKKLGLVGSTISSGQRKPGVERAPQLFRDAGLITALKSLGLQVRDYGNLKESQFPLKELKPEEISNNPN
jgi:arginase family enzyme